MYGVYKITNKINKMFYIGSSNDPVFRFKQHMHGISSRNPYFSEDIKRYGPENFEFEILFESNDLSEVRSMERKLQRELWCDRIYNLRINGLGGDTSQYRDYQNPDYLFKLSRSQKGKKVSVETRETLRKMMKKAWKEHPETWKNFKGPEWTPEFRKKHGDRIRGEKNPMFGKHWSEEMRKQISERQKGKQCWINPEGKKIYRFEKPEGSWELLTERTKRIVESKPKKERTPKRGFKHSEETKKKMSESRKLYFERLRTNK
jgi:group I intron endonuclease